MPQQPHRYVTAIGGYPLRVTPPTEVEPLPTRRTDPAPRYGRRRLRRYALVATLVLLIAGGGGQWALAWFTGVVAGAGQAASVHDAAGAFGCATATASASTLAAGSTATVGVSSGACPWAFSFAIPTGATGAKGDTGAQGTTGATGAPGTNGTNGTNGTSATVAAGADSCTSGGITVTASNGSQPVCNGAPGTPGTNGVSGRELDSVTVTVAVASACQNQTGGFCINSGSTPVRGATATCTGTKKVEGGGISQWTDSSGGSDAGAITVYSQPLADGSGWTAAYTSLNLSSGFVLPHQSVGTGTFIVYAICVTAS